MMRVEATLDNLVSGEGAAMQLDFVVNMGIDMLNGTEVVWCLIHQAFD
jgi:hypothetical protein